MVSKTEVGQRALRRLKSGLYKLLVEVINMESDQLYEQKGFYTMNESGLGHLVAV